jgi:hypothetical protein
MVIPYVTVTLKKWRNIMKTVMLFNFLIKAVYTVCVTLASMHFNSPAILWWFLLLPLLGYEYRETPIKNMNNEEDKR